MKLSHFDSRPLANEGVECALVDPITKQKTKAGIVLLGADSDVYKNKTKELQERRRLSGRAPTPAEIEADSIEILAACARSWHDVEDDAGKEIEFNEKNIKAALAIPEVYQQVANFSMNRANFFKSASTA